MEVSLAEVSKLRTVGGLAGLAIERLRAKFNVSAEVEGDAAAAPSDGVTK